MKRLRGRSLGRIREEGDRIEFDQIVLELYHGRTLTLRRQTIAGEDGITLSAGIERKGRTANARFVIRIPNFGHVQLNIEQAR
jgi:hypothetical protein